MTSIGITEKDRFEGKAAEHNSTFLKRLDSQLQFTAREGAEIVLHAALLRREDAKPGELVLPYFYGFSFFINGSNEVHGLIPHSIKSVANIVYEHLFQKLTYKRKHVWVCPASVESRDVRFQVQFKEKYLKGL
jgi:hypothetical protein